MKGGISVGRKLTTIGLCAILMLVVFNSGCLDNGKSGKLEILNNDGVIEHLEYLEMYEVKVTGQAKNVGNAMLSYAEVNAKFYDSSGNLIGTSLDNINDLGPGEIWNFEIIYFDSSCTVTKYKVYVGSCF